MLRKKIVGTNVEKVVIYFTVFTVLLNHNQNACIFQFLHDIFCKIDKVASISVQTFQTFHVVTMYHSTNRKVKSKTPRPPRTVIKL